MTTHTFHVQSCTARHDGAYAVIYRDGPIQKLAVSLTKLEEGVAFAIGSDGSAKAVERGRT